MGLDITAYTNLQPYSTLDEDGEPIHPDTKEYVDCASIYNHPDFPGRCSFANGYYSFDDSFGFRAGSYGGYNLWRENLAELAGYPKLPSESVLREGTPSFATGAFASGGGPFYELINFSDCEGTISGETARKIYKDFQDYAERAASHWDEQWQERYQFWMKAFAMAENNGAVCFS